MRTPFQILNSAIFYIPVFVIYNWQPLWVREKCLRDKTMDRELPFPRIKCDTGISIPPFGRLKKFPSVFAIILPPWMRSPFFFITPNLSIFRHRISSLKFRYIFHFFSVKGTAAWQKPHLSRAKLIMA